ncbi:erythrocyte membrane protein 1, PfEMP1 [Plasmodium reichenowi]|uniref:Erythrocyte membrane protein 1, PfEMP1 n=1 Tax=Plasmodium reichenowi TaxID=5854 RepID=A0A2P9D681_PLARE|nr:erythrocyte membrane protein 1, PfEMP1 [Plasmodium reichenowi]
MVTTTRRGGGGNDYTKATDAKDFLDQIGEIVQKKVRNAAIDYVNNLKGLLERATFEKKKIDVSVPCDLDHEIHTNVTSGYGKDNPCRNEKGKRFSEVHGGECDKRKIKGSNDNEGACAPYRRLHLCDRNLENINDFDNINNDTLLVDVCLAAKYEGDSMRGDYGKYHTGSSGSTICTVLARSFADIGDIVRGRDLYRGDNGKDKLEKNLKRIFEKIYNKLEDTNVQEHYEDAKGNFFKLREDWWNANRETVWKAITCGAVGGTYFRRTCSNDQENTQGNCQCIGGTVPTNFDYVPQYLRWFEEWAEEFCRKKKRFVDMVKTNCRGESGDPKYCSGNGYDCEETIRAIGKLVIDKECTNCSVWCRLYENWIDNQKQEFVKQKQKYTKEIEKYTKEASRSSNRKKRGTTTTKYDGYESKFYDELTSKYGNVDDFLRLLNNENECKKLETDNENKVDFNEKHDDDKNSNKKGTFYHSEYCKPCPECGVIKNGEGTFRTRGKEDEICKNGNYLYRPRPNVTPTTINVLYSGETKEKIRNKLHEFCDKKDNDSEIKKLNDEWKCYEGKDVHKNGVKEEEYENLVNSGGVCILKNENKNEKEKNSENEPDEFQKTFNDFFNVWVGNLLSDTIHWRTEHAKCLRENKLKKCEKGCNSNCKCFIKWISQKKNEWTKIKEHFDKQTDLPSGFTHYALLERVLEEYYFENIKKAYGELHSIQQMRQMIQEKEKRGKDNTEHVDALDVLFDHEEDDANTCKNCQPKKFRNPCYGDKTGGDATKQFHELAQTVAADIHKKVQEKMLERSGKNGGDGKGASGENVSVLKADAKQGTYTRGGIGSDLANGNICNIGKKHSNAAKSESKDPCNGKATERFNIGIPWETGRKMDMTVDDAYMPPRRRHMCTSNLEKINVDEVTKNSNVNDKFLVDVLIAAKSEAEYIKNKYNEKQNNGKNGLRKDQATACRAIRYSFADIGDIIKGTDLWDRNSGEVTTQGNLVQIFKQIKENLPADIKEKYTDDNRTTKPPHKLLRSDWWEANRDQVWEAMKCHKLSGSVECSDTTPYDDYIPQRLRWMTEWAEWYCKYQSQQYDELEGKCAKCMGKGKGQCTSVDGYICVNCKNACDAYKTEIQKWKTQWQKMEMKYTISYSQAKNNYRNAYDGAGPDYHQMLDFLSKLHDEIVKRDASGSTIKSPYQRAYGYIHQELRNPGCDTQTQFCDKKNGSNNKEYAFKDTPHNHDDACKCTGRTEPAQDSRGRSDSFDDPPPVQREEESEEEDEDGASEGEGEEESSTDVVELPKEDICNIVKTVFNDGTTLKEACSQKYGLPQRYWGWRCISDTTSSGSSATGKDVSGKATTSDNSGSICVPPRRRKLYIGGLTKWANTVGGNNKEEGSQVTVEGQDAGSKAPVSSGSTETPSQPTEASSTTSDSTSTTATPEDPPEASLRRAFVESAAVETFFLWHNYKERWKLQNRGTGDGLGSLEYGAPRGGFGVSGYSAGENGGGEMGAKGPYTGYTSDSDNTIFGKSTGGIRVAGPQLGGVGGPYPPVLPGVGVAPGMPGAMQGGTSWTLGADGANRGLGGSMNSENELSPVGGPLLDDQIQQRSQLELGTLTLPGSDTSDPDPNDPSNLQSGKIPPDFLRQMFYTIADYRDILVRGGSNTNDSVSSSNDNNRNIVLEASGDKQDEMKQIQEQLKKFFQNGGNPENSVNNPSPRGPSSSSHSGENPSSWWENNAKDIWEGMVCALTYRESEEINTDGTKKIEKNNDVYTKFFGDEKNDNNGTFKTQYDYNSVKLKNENSDTDRKYTEDPTNTPKLKDFVERPPFFRYLEEWGTEFCVKRKDMLEKIKEECTEEGGLKQKYSGDGEECDKIHSEDPTNVPDLDKLSCSRHCRFYKRWINTKRSEFDKQEKAYKTELESDKSDNGGNGFCVTQGTCNEAKDFLQKLGPCKNNESESGNNKTIFEDIDKTFGHEKYCAPCSQFKINCENGSCGSAANGHECKNRTITADNFQEKMTQSTQKLDMRVSDNNDHKFDDGLEACGSANIFKGIKKEEWSCGKFCGYVVCKSKNGNGETASGENKDQIITIRALVTHWVHYFLEDYNRIKYKISHCINNGQNKCKCNDKCKCVQKWAEKKKTEWQKIKDRFLDQYNSKDQADYNVKTVFDDFKDRPIFQKAIKPCDNLTKFEDSIHCNGGASSGNANGQKSDIIDCLLKKLGEKAKKCKENHQPSDKNQAQCDSPAPIQTPPEEPFEEENPEENTAPKFCPDIKKPEPAATEETCDAVDPGDVPKVQDDKKEEEEDGEKDGGNASPEGKSSEGPKEPRESEENPVQPSVEEPAKDQPTETPSREDTTPAAPTPELQSDEPTNSISDILSSTIPFGIALALGSIAFFFMKKKTKSSVDLLRVLQIPQNDYGIPTFKSSNRYIPYASAQYRGKRYIYIEGDSGTDSGYTDHYSDITSSSESEYEEFDINDIYVPGSPKYKTLIEVVLEPSGKNTTTSDTPPPITDEEWNELKKDFISNMLQNTQNTEPNILHNNVDNNTNPKTLHVSMDEKPFIMSIHDSNLLNGEEYNYDMTTNSGQNNLYSGIDPTSSNHGPTSGKNGPTSDKNGPYSGIDLINDSLSGNKHIDIYDEMLKRKENELFGTQHHPKHIINSVAKETNSDPIHNQLDLFHKWLDRHRNMCEQWDTNNKKEELLDKLKEEWNKENNTNSGLTHISSNMPSDENSIKNVLNTDVSIQIDMDNPKPINEFTNMDTIIDNLEKYSEPYYDIDEDDIIYFDIDDEKTPMYQNNMDNNKSNIPTKVQIEMNVINNKELLQKEYPIWDIWNI